MAKRAARRKNRFLVWLYNNTLAYINEQNQVLKKQSQQIVVRTKQQIEDAVKSPFRRLQKGGVVRFYHKGKDVKETDSNFGKVYADAGQLPTRLRDTMNAVMLKYGEQIFRESQRLVPIDKRYNKLNTKNSVEVKKYRNRGIIEISGIKDIDFKRRRGREASFRRFYESKYDGQVKYKWTSLSAGSGWYTGEQAEFIKKYLSGSNRRSIYYIYYNSQEGKIYDFGGNVVLSMNGRGSMSLDLKGEKDVVTANRQVNFGNQELKKGGKLDKTPYGYRITYSAFDDSRPAGDRYNYAALQHDNLAFKHKYGQALFLYEPVKHYRSRLIKEMRQSVSKEIERGK